MNEFSTKINDSTETISSGTEGSAKFGGGTLGRDGRVYCIPYSAEVVLSIGFDYEDSSSYDILGFPVPSGAQRWMGGVLTANDRIVGIPAIQENLLIIEPGFPREKPWMLQAYYNKM